MPTRRIYLQKDILSVNKMIKENELKGFYEVIDFYGQFIDSNGELIQELTKDGVHLNDKGYQKWVDFEKPIIKALGKNHD
ncbi:MAG: hypothetical protein EOO20_23490 [Chryseobacterium sp.]|nr:MAG: hypothetical protein EOO20_23490 [Chryseobacterium sp.]